MDRREVLGAAARTWTWYSLLLLLLPALPAATGAATGRGPSEGELVTAHWLSGGRVKRAVNILDKPVSPARGEIAVTAEGRPLVLVLERNQHLLSPEYTETHYTADGDSVTLSPNYTEHCYYHGHVQGHKESWVVLSTCSGISGLIVLNSNDSYYVKPHGISDPELHLIYRTEYLPMKGGTCGHSTPSENHAADLASFISSPAHSRMKRDVWRTPKFMELFIVADHTLFVTQKKDLGHTKQRIMEIANYVDKFYRLLNIKVALIGLEVWTERDQCSITDDANATLWSFLKWKQKLKARKKHDNAQLLTGVTFKGTTIGMAPLEGMCAGENSGGVSMDHSELPIGAAATMSHEIGHNFGMSHDSEGCCVEAKAEEGGCVMAAATGHPFPRVFSSCSKKQLLSYFQKGGGMCLFNMPNTKDLVAGKKCGNGFLEEGEECDCGELEECINPCCNANNCTLKEDAQCAHGDCCQDCKLKTPGIMCREPSGSCDLAEFCTGASPYCPPNVYLLDGSGCTHEEAYCFNGMCMTHQQQCVQLWGPGARPAPDACFRDVNAAGDSYGNCGKSQGQFVKCDKRDAMCGKIQCQSSAARPKGPNTVSMDTTIRFEGREVKCRGTFTYSTQDEQGDMPDPGLVLTGTKCGPGMVCKDRRCQNSSFLEMEQCVAKCHGNGVCNSNKNCHCNVGWAPPTCDKTGLGGSVDSGPIQHDNHEAVMVALLLIFLVFLPAAAFGLFYCYRKENSILNRVLKKSKATYRNGTLNRQKSDNSHTNSAFTVKTFTSSAKPISNNKVGKKGFPAKSGAVQNGFQPVNIVRPLRPAPSPVMRPQTELKPCRPPPPAKKSPMVRAKTADIESKLLPPKKPLPTSPLRTPQLIPKQNPPRRPLPGNPMPAREPLLVMVPSTSNKPPPTNTVSQLSKPLRPVLPQKAAAGVKVPLTSFPLRK
ncbi:disintegrin and metalloproteinase domain-containing protein 33-like isoform X2 [Ambystoma mexicanum]|uniref:disintegrin and metalloproteinase domain-containing protein 33-like isoform X2 n=1 Tax=Ambystoma mexicanum TaxID=8296 RepID=UPI0037E979BA